MQPLYLTHYTIATSLGAGIDATFNRLSAGQTGLTPQTYPGDLATWAGHVHAIDNMPLDDSLAAFECRNNRLAALALAQDGFMDAVADLRGEQREHRAHALAAGREQVAGAHVRDLVVE